MLKWIAGLCSRVEASLLVALLIVVIAASSVFGEDTSRAAATSSCSNDKTAACAPEEGEKNSSDGPGNATRVQPSSSASTAADTSQSGGVPPTSAPTPDQTAPATEPSVGPGKSLEHNLVHDLIAQEKFFWTAPMRLRLQDATWLLPMVGATASLISVDRRIEQHLPDSVTLQDRSKQFGTYGAAAFAGVVGSMYVWGWHTNNDQLRTTSLLSAEAAANTLILAEAIKNITQRQRPLEGNGRGNFWQGGQSFPSEHAAAAWAIATVISEAYPGPLTRFLSYGGASAITAARVLARQHFTSDVVVGSALGIFVGHEVYSRRGDPAARKSWGTFERPPRENPLLSPTHMGSPYVPLDSWVYGAFDRLAAMGYADTAFLGLRPWTRMECARLLDEMEEPTAAGALGGPQPALVQDLREEFKAEIGRWHGDSNIAADLESVYTRVGGIAGPALYDGYHLGQTITNDYGRPFRQGFDAITGFTSHAVAGPFSVYFRGEYQHAPSVPNYPAAARQILANIDSIFPVAPATQFPAEDRFDMVEGYAAVNIKGMQISFGKQSLWWGPGSGGALMFTNNAEPFYTVRVTRTIPLKLPSILGKLGPMQTDFILGRLGGHRSPVHPYIDGEKISFKPTPNLELGFSKISIFAGGPIPLNWHTFYKSTFSVGDHSTSDLPGFDPGDRRGSFDFRYRLPGLRRWATLYSDSLCDDDPSPLAAPRRAAFNPGLYISHLPHMEKLDFRVEAAYTDTPTSRSIGGRWIYWNFVYHDSHTNDSELMGHWVGREGKGVQVWSTYWLSAESKIQLGYRNGKVNGDFIPGGGTLNDVSGRVDFKLRPNLLISGWLQYEQWKFPLIAPADKFQSNIAASVQLTFTPHWTVKR